MSADCGQGGVRALAIEVLADVTERLAPAGKYVARDIRNGILSSDNERAIWAIIEFARRLTAPATDTPVPSDAVLMIIRNVLYRSKMNGCSADVYDTAEEIAAALAKHPTSPEDAA